MQKITVIVPAYNAEKTIKRCIDSILNQTFDDFNLIIVNDGSSDKTKNILNTYDDKRIIIINQANKGAGSARNKALNNVKTKYVTFIDADDYLDKKYLEILYNQIEKNKADIACCNRIQNGKKIEVLNNKEALKYLLCLKEKYGVCVIAKIFKYSIIKDIKFDLSNHFEDIDFIFKSFLKATKVVYIHKKLYNYEIFNYSRSKYVGIDRLQACINLDEKIKKNAKFIYNDYKVYSMFNAIAIYNQMTLSEKIDKKLENEVKRFVRNNIKYVLKSNYSFIKKMQIYIFNYNIYFYNILIKILRG